MTGMPWSWAAHTATGAATEPASAAANASRLISDKLIRRLRRFGRSVTHSRRRHHRAGQDIGGRPQKQTHKRDQEVRRGSGAPVVLARPRRNTCPDRRLLLRQSHNDYSPLGEKPSSRPSERRSGDSRRCVLEGMFRAWKRRLRRLKVGAPPAVARGSSGTGRSGAWTFSFGSPPIPAPGRRSLP